jgi:hypothetical protein
MGLGERESAVTESPTFWIVESTMVMLFHPTRCLCEHVCWVLGPRYRRRVRVSKEMRMINAGPTPLGDAAGRVSRLHSSSVHTSGAPVRGNSDVADELRHERDG